MTVPRLKNFDFTVHSSLDERAKALGNALRPAAAKGLPVQQKFSFGPIPGPGLGNYVSRAKNGRET
jgi:hypothetical protein